MLALKIDRHDTTSLKPLAVRQDRTNQPTNVIKQKQVKGLGLFVLFLLCFVLFCLFFVCLFVGVFVSLFVCFSLNYYVNKCNLFLPQLLIVWASVFVGPSAPNILLPPRRQKLVEVYCRFGYGFLASCAYNGLIVVGCCFYAFKARKIPDNFNESKFIGVSVYSTVIICLSAIPVYVLATKVEQMIGVLSVTLGISSKLNRRLTARNRRFWAVAIVLNNGNCNRPEAAVLGGQLPVEF